MELKVELKTELKVQEFTFPDRKCKFIIHELLDVFKAMHLDDITKVISVAREEIQVLTLGQINT